MSFLWNKLFEVTDHKTSEFEVYLQWIHCAENLGNLVKPLSM